MSGRRSRNDADTEQLRTEILDDPRARQFVRLSKLERRLGVAVIVILLLFVMASFGLQVSMHQRTGRAVEESTEQSRQNERLLRQLDADARDRDRAQARGARAVTELIRIVQEGNEQSQANAETLRTLDEGSDPQPTIVVVVEDDEPSEPRPAPTRSPDPSPEPEPSHEPEPTPSPTPPIVDVDDLVCGLTGECSGSASVLDLLSTNGGD